MKSSALLALPTLTLGALALTARTALREPLGASPGDEGRVGHEILVEGAGGGVVAVARDEPRLRVQR